MSSSFDFLIPKAPVKEDFYSYGTVTTVAPLRVLIDGDVDDVEAVPTTLASLSIGDRVYVTIKDRQLIVLGIVGGIGITTDQIDQIVPKKPLAPTSFTLYDSDPGDGIPEYPEAYEDSSLGYLARVRFIWSPVFVDVDGDPITLKSYEIWGRRVGDTTTRLLYTAGSNDLSAFLDGFKVTDTWEFFVRAVGSVGSVPSDFFPNTGLEVDFPELLLPVPPIPNTPQLVPGRGNIEVTWDGTFTNAAEATHDFRGIYIYASETSFTSTTDPGVQLIGFMAGVEADKLTIGRPVTTWFIGLEGYSNAGKRSALSPIASTTVLSVADPAIVAELDSRLDQAEIDLASAFTEIDTVDGKVVVLEASALVDIDYEYAVSTSNTVAPTTGWSTNTPVWQEGEYIWFRTVTITGDNTPTTSAPALLTGNTGDQGDPGTPSTYVFTGNESQIISTTVEGTVDGAQTIVVPFAGYIGTARAAASVVASGLPSGISVATNVAATASADGTLTLNVANGSTLGGTLSGSFTLTFTCNSMAFVKKFSWAKAVTDSPKIFHSTSTPGVTSAVDGSTWFQHDTTLAGNIIGQWTRQSGIWSSTPLNNQVIANLDAGKITSGYIASARIDANTISATQIVASEALWTKVLGAHKIVSNEIEADAITSAHISAGAIEANMLNVQYSDPTTGGSLTLTADGLRIWGTEDTTGDPDISLTTSSLNSFELKDSTTGTSVVLSKSGDISANRVNTDELTIGGETLEELFDSNPLGLVVRGFEATHSGDSLPSGRSGMLCVRFRALAGRMYRINFIMPSVVNYPGTRLVSELYVSEATPPSLPSAIQKDGTNGTRIYNQNTVQPGTGSGVERMNGHFFKSWSSDTNVEIMAALWTTASGSSIWTSEYQTYLHVEDVGPTLSSDGFLPEASPTQQYTEQWTASSFQSYYSNGGSQYSGSGPANTNPIQGYTSYWPSGGLQSSLIFFNDADMRSQLSGATIDKIEITLNMEHFYSSAGGTARVHMHDFTSAPSSYNYSTSGNFTLMSDVAYTARGQTKTFTVSNTYGDRLKAGTGHGIALDPRGSTSNTYYGYSSWSTKPKIKITYTK